MNKKIKWIFLAKVLTVAILHFKKTNSNLGRKSWQQETLPTKLSCHPYSFFLFSLRGLPILKEVATKLLFQGFLFWIHVEWCKYTYLLLYAWQTTTKPDLCVCLVYTGWENFSTQCHDCETMARTLFTTVSSADASEQNKAVAISQGPQRPNTLNRELGEVIERNSCCETQWLALCCTAWLYQCLETKMELWGAKNRQVGILRLGIFCLVLFS